MLRLNTDYLQHERDYNAIQIQPMLRLNIKAAVPPCILLYGIQIQPMLRLNLKVIISVHTA